MSRADILGVPATFVVALIGLGAAITADVVPGVFSVDDNNYLINVVALRHGRVTVPQTDGLPPSAELLYFDPGPWTRTVTSTPVASTAPPLYAPIALPFSFAGWRGLVALNTAAYLLTALMVFACTRQHARRELTPWLAAAAFALAGFSIEYAEGVWPHMLSVGLCTAGILAAARALDGGRPAFGALSGGLLGLATGVRYQNAIVLAAVAVGVLLLSKRRGKPLMALLLAAALPLGISSAINHARLNSWNPISKGPGYLSISAGSGPSASAFDPFVMLWARLVDYSARPPLRSSTFASWQTYDDATGAHLMLGTVLKKAVLQSAPWAALGLSLMGMAWLRAKSVPPEQRPTIRLVAMVSAAVLATFSMSGIYRDDGFNFNQRYLLELVPLLAIAFGWSIDRIGVSPRSLAAGAGVGGLIVLVLLTWTPITGGPEVPFWTLRQHSLLKLPLILGLVLVVSWVLARRGTFVAVWSMCLGLSLGWAVVLHIAQDVQASHRTRRYNLERTRSLNAVLLNGDVLVAYWWHKDPAVPLVDDRDLLILDVRADDGRDAPMLIRDLLGRGRRVLLLETGFPEDVFARLASEFDMAPVGDAGPRLRKLQHRRREPAPK